MKHSPAGHAGGGAFFPIEQRGNKEKSDISDTLKKGNKRGTKDKKC